MESPLAADTPLSVERRQIEAWRRMTPAEKAATITRLTETACALTAAGVRHRYPDASPREVFLRVAVITLREDLARAAYPEAASLAPEP